MIEMVKLFALIASQLETLMIFKMKQKKYLDALLFLYKNRSHNLPSFTSTAHLGTTNWYDAESNLNNNEHLKTEKDWLSYFKQIYHDGAPIDITRCSLT